MNLAVPSEDPTLLLLQLKRQGREEGQYSHVNDRVARSCIPALVLGDRDSSLVFLRFVLESIHFAETGGGQLGEEELRQGVEGIDQVCTQPCSAAVMQYCSNAVL